MKETKYRLTGKQFFKFVNVGLLSTFFNYSCFYILFSFLSFNYLLSSATGYLFGVFIGFMFNKGWTFQYQNITTKEPLQYITLYSTSLLLGLALLRVLVNNLNIIPEIANVIVIGFTTTTNFLGLKFWVFRKLD